MELNNKVVLITGGLSGLGAAAAHQLSEQGMKVAIIDQEPSAISLQTDTLILQADVTDSQAMEHAINEIVKRFGEIHVCVNCAGVASAARIVGKNGPMSLVAFQQVIQVNLIGTFNVMRLAAAQMIKQNPVGKDGEKGVIINTSSIAADDGQIGQAAYSASKGGVSAMTLPAAREFGQHGIRVMAIAPGVMTTPMVSQMRPELTQQWVETIPFPKRFGSPNEYAILVQHIIENEYLNGEVIRLDGAMRMK